MKYVTELAPAKVNLFLRILGKRPDGYHEISTLFEKINICDKITVKELPKGIKIKCGVKSVPSGKTNICYKAASVLKKRCRIRTGFEIKIEKNIPVGAGLGGGSSDGAAVLRAVNKLLRLCLPDKELILMASELGSDVSFFIMQDSFAIGRGRGELLKALKSDICIWHLIIYPNILMKTRTVYDKYDKIRQVEPVQHKRLGSLPSRYKTDHASIGLNSGDCEGLTLTLNKPIAKMIAPVTRIDNMCELTALLHNDLEDVVLEREPVIKNIKGMFVSHGAKGALVSGSGSSVFGVYETKKEAHKAAEYFQSALPRGKGWRIFTAETLLDRERSQRLWKSPKSESF